MAQAKLGFARLTIAALAATALSGCGMAGPKKQTVAAVPSQSLIAPNGGFSDETPAQRRAEWLQAPASSPAGTSTDDK